MSEGHIRDLIEAYALGILDAGERRAVEAYLDTGDAEALAALCDASEVAARLAAAVAQEDPPARVKERLMARIGVAGRAVDEGAHGNTSALADARARPGSIVRSDVDAPPESSGGEQGVAMRARHTGQRRAWIVALVACAAAVFFAVRSADLNRQLNHTRVRLNVSVERAAVLEREVQQARHRIALGDKGVRFVEMDGVAPNRHAVGWVVLRPDGKSGIVYVYGFPAAPPGHRYQLWSYRGTRVQGNGMFTVDDRGRAVLELPVVRDAACITEFAVTIESAGGAPRPTGMFYARGENRFHDVQ